MLLIRNRINFSKLLFIVIIFSIFSGCIENNIEDNYENLYEINIGITYDISGFYPWINRDTISLSINQNFYNPLVEIDNKTRGIIPALAISWNNPNELTWRFFLREGVKFHNGNNFTSEDVKFTIEYLKNYSYFQDRLSSINNITIIDDNTIDLISENKNSLLLYDLISVSILSKDYIIGILNNDETWPIGTGGYKLKEYVPNSYISLVRFDEYWKGKPQINQVNFTIIDTNEDLLNGLINRSLDIAPLPFDDIEKIQDINHLKLLSVETPGVVYIGFDFRENNSYGYPDGENPTSDLRVRKAIYHAMNIDEFIEKKMNTTSRKPITQLITSDTFGYNPDIKRLKYDIEKANQLMIEAGYINGFNITLDCPDGNSSIKICNKIVEQLSLINVTVILNPLTYNEYLAKLYLKNTSFFITGFSPLTAEGAISLLFHTSDMNNSKGIWNYGNYSNNEVDSLCEIIHNTTDTYLRKIYIQDVFSIAMEDIAYIPLYSSIAFYGVRNDINWNPRPSLYILVEEINIDE